MYRLNINKLNGMIVEKGMTKDGLAQSIGVDRATFYRRLKNNSLRLIDVHRICEAMHLTIDEAISIFLS